MGRQVAEAVCKPSEARDLATDNSKDLVHLERSSTSLVPKYKSQGKGQGYKEEEATTPHCFFPRPVPSPPTADLHHEHVPASLAVSFPYIELCWGQRKNHRSAWRQERACSRHIARGCHCPPIKPGTNRAVGRVFCCPGHLGLTPRTPHLPQVTPNPSVSQIPKPQALPFLSHTTATIHTHSDPHSRGPSMKGQISTNNSLTSTPKLSPDIGGAWLSPRMRQRIFQHHSGPGRVPFRMV